MKFEMHKYIKISLITDQSIMPLKLTHTKLLRKHVLILDHLNIINMFILYIISQIILMMYFLHIQTIRLAITF